MTQQQTKELTDFLREIYSCKAMSPLTPLKIALGPNDYHEISGLLREANLPEAQWDDDGYLLSICGVAIEICDALLPRAIFFMAQDKQIKSEEIASINAVQTDWLRARAAKLN